MSKSPALQLSIQAVAAVRGNSRASACGFLLSRTATAFGSDAISTQFPPPRC